MSLWPSLHTADAFGASVAPTAVLSRGTCSYSIQEFIGEGVYGKVARGQRIHTNEAVAIKILKYSEFSEYTYHELSILEHIRVLNADHTNVVKFFECFHYMGQMCLAFEMLDRSLYDLLVDRDWDPLTVKEVRPIAQQMLVALDALKGLGVLHADIKPDNVMLVDQQNQPFRLKLIDFGEAMLVSFVEPGLEIQPTGYRAPEVALGLPFTESIDVWGAGCILAFVYFAQNLFPVYCDYQMMKRMVEVFGQPEDHLLCAGEYTKCFFSQEEAVDGPAWRLMTPDEYTVANDIAARECSGTNLPSSLDDLVDVYPKEDNNEFEDRKAFIDLLKQLLHPIGDQRVSPHQALQHSFFTMSHLTELPDSSDYLTTSRALMSFCTMEESEPAAWSEGELPNVTCDTEPSHWSDEELSIVTCDTEPSDLTSEGLVIVTCDTEPSDLTSEELSIVTCDTEPSDWTSEGLVIVTCDTEPSDLTSEGLVIVTCDQEPSDRISHEGQSLSDDEDISRCSSYGKNLRDRFRKFFGRLVANLSCCCRPTVED